MDHEITLSQQLASEMEDAAKRIGVTPSTLGRLAGQGGHFYDRLVAGKRVWPETAAKVRDFMATQVSQAS